MSNWLLLSFFALVCWGITGNTQKLSTNYISSQFSFLGFALAFVPIAILIMLVFPVERAMSPQVLALGILGGVLNSFSALTSFAAFEAGASPRSRCRLCIFILCSRWYWRAFSCMRRLPLHTGPGSFWLGGGLAAIEGITPERTRCAAAYLLL